MSELIERVAMLIFEAEEDAYSNEIATAAITAVFDWLATNGEAAANTIEYPGSKRTALDYWPIMLAEMRKQALG